MFLLGNLGLIDQVNSPASDLQIRRNQLSIHTAGEVDQAKYVTFQIAEVTVPREMFAAILDRIQRFGVQPPLVRHG